MRDDPCANVPSRSCFPRCHRIFLILPPSLPPSSTDLSLRSALERDVIERQSRVDGTMALPGSSGGSGGGMGAASATATGTGSGGGGGGGRGLGPWFEQLHAFGTRVVVSAELHRRLSHPVEPPKVRPS